MNDKGLSREGQKSRLRHVYMLRVYGTKKQPPFDSRSEKPIKSAPINSVNQVGIN